MQLRPNRLVISYVLDWIVIMFASSTTYHAFIAMF